MNITLIQIGKTDASYVREGIDLYLKRINHYVKFDIVTLADVRETKNLSREQQKAKEGESILRRLSEADRVVLLDENGAQGDSMQFAAWMQKRMSSGIKRLVFVIGGPYGFSPEVYRRADEKISLSKMTFSHQLIRVIFAEQLYRAFTIINHEPYHHQ